MKFWKAFLPVIFVFVIVAVLILLLESALTGYGFNTKTLFWGNVFLFLLSLISFFIQQKGNKPGAPQLFVRYFYISFLIKFLLVAIVVLVFATVAGKVNRSAIIACMALYLVYMFIEIIIALKSGKTNNG
ncbi:MAG: hypothetical protein QM802_00485 [Agriterribacter sp.]